jgi:hypothetical protein
VKNEIVNAKYLMQNRKECVHSDIDNNYFSLQYIIIIIRVLWFNDFSDVLLL